MDIAGRYQHLEKSRVEFQNAGLKATAFTGCTEDEVGGLLLLQADVLAKSYKDFSAMIEFASTRYIYAKEYQKRKAAFAAYAAKNADVAATGGADAATVMVYRNAMRFELSELVRFFFVFWATYEDISRSPAHRITPDPEEILERYGKSSGCLVVIGAAVAVAGSLFAWA